MAGMEPRVGVVIANHNYGHRIGEALNSVVNQKYPADKIRVAVCDDGSTDDSLEVINKYSGILNLTVLQNDIPQKQAYARNRCIEALWDDVDIFAILDADDVMLPNKTAFLVNELVAGAGFVGVAYADYIHFYDDDRPELLEFKEPFSRARLVNECIVHSNAFITKQALEYVREKDGFFFDEDLPPCEDYDLWLRISDKYMICHVPIVLSKVFVHQMNSTNTTTDKHRQAQLQKIWNKLTVSQ